MPGDTLPLPLAFDLIATLVSAVAGAIVAVQRKYDPVGVFALALVGGLGGALLRDGIFLQNGPPVALRDNRILGAVLAGAVAGAVFGQWSPTLQRAFLLFDALGLAVYAVVGADRSLTAGISDLGSVLVGVVNAVGGGVLRDVLMREEPILFKPGQFYGTAALAGAGLFVGLREGFAVPPTAAAWSALAAGITLRLLAVRYDWRTPPAHWKHWVERD